MITIRRSDERGYANHDWLDTYHTFSFADYYDPSHMGFSVLRVINEDKISAASGFGMHGHRDMEIITYVIEGALEHKDSMGNSAIIRPGEIQRMSAGTGVKHSEFNNSKDLTTHLLQIWIEPERKNIQPSYDQKSFVEQLNQNEFALIASKQGNDKVISLNQDVNLYVCKSNNKGEKSYSIQNKRKVWIQIVAGQLNVGGKLANAGDGAAVTDVEKVDLVWSPGIEFLLFDLP